MSLKATLTHTASDSHTHPDTLEDTWKLPPGFGGAANHNPPKVTLGNGAPRGKTREEKVKGPRQKSSLMKRRKDVL